MADIHVTVAAVVEHHGKFLIVQERDQNNRVVYNQPAGHVEHGESIVAAIKREVYEETGLKFEPDQLIGTYFLTPADNGKHYLRFCFSGSVNHQKCEPQDADIEAALWLTLHQITELRPSLRSGLVLKCLDDYLSGKSFPLEMFQHASNESLMMQTCYDALLNR